MVDGTALEMRRACKGSVGSNPTLSAIKKGPIGPFFDGGLGEVNGPLFDRSATADLGRRGTRRSERSEDENSPKAVFANPTRHTFADATQLSCSTFKT